MRPVTRKRILDLLKRHNIMSIATVRRDGYPQATTVTYANDGLNLYFGCDRAAQKVRNIRRSSKVSLTIDRDYEDWSRIKGLSMAADAEVLSRRSDIEHARMVLARKFPQWADLSPADLRSTAFVRVVPKVISVLDYTRGFGHADLVRVTRRSLLGEARVAGRSRQRKGNASRRGRA
jgi:general stress protein 26